MKRRKIDATMLDKRQYYPYNKEWFKSDLTANNMLRWKMRANSEYGKHYAIKNSYEEKIRRKNERESFWENLSCCPFFEQIFVLLMLGGMISGPVMLFIGLFDKTQPVFPFLIITIVDLWMLIYYNIYKIRVTKKSYDNIIADLDKYKKEDPWFKIIDNPPNGVQVSKSFLDLINTDVVTYGYFAAPYISYCPFFIELPGIDKWSHYFLSNLKPIDNSELYWFCYTYLDQDDSIGCTIWNDNKVQFVYKKYDHYISITVMCDNAEKICSMEDNPLYQEAMMIFSNKDHISTFFTYDSVYSLSLYNYSAWIKQIHPVKIHVPVYEKTCKFLLFNPHRISYDSQKGCKGINYGIISDRELQSVAVDLSNSYNMISAIQQRYNIKSWSSYIVGILVDENNNPVFVNEQEKTMYERCVNAGLTYSVYYGYKCCVDAYGYTAYRPLMKIL